MRPAGLGRILVHPHFYPACVRAHRPLEPHEKHRSDGPVVECGNAGLRVHPELQTAFCGPNRHRPGRGGIRTWWDGPDCCHVFPGKAGAYAGRLECIHPPWQCPGDCARRRYRRAFWLASRFRHCGVARRHRGRVVFFCQRLPYHRPGETSRRPGSLPIPGWGGGISPGTF